MFCYIVAGIQSGFEVGIGGEFATVVGFHLGTISSLFTIVPKTKTKTIKKRDTMKKLDTAIEMKAVAKICARWKYAKAHNVGDAL